MNVAIKVSKILKITYIVIAVLSIVSTVLAVLFLAVANLGQVKDFVGVIIVAAVARLVWCGTMIALIHYTYKASLNCHTQILAFHDFLIQYRQTPRSKILRKHLPSMEAVVEEASMFEQSAMTFSDPSISSSSINRDNSTSLAISKRKNSHS